MSAAARPEALATKVAIVGSGPVGFYTAGHLLAAGDGVVVDMLDRLPTPWRLVRSGAAPDHPKINGVTRVFEKTAARPQFRFFGNVEIGRNVPHEDLVERYHAVVYATGSATDRPLGIPAEDLHGGAAATDFVAWYNAHPDHCERSFDLSGERAVVVGRMLALTPRELGCTDIAGHALDGFARSRIREIVVVGRRGPAQAAFTNPDLLELGELSEADVVVDAGERERGLTIHDPAIEQDAATRRKLEIQRDYARRAPAGRPKRVVLRFSRCAARGASRRSGCRTKELTVDADGRVRAVLGGRARLIAAGRPRVNLTTVEELPATALAERRRARALA